MRVGSYHSVPPYEPARQPRPRRPALLDSYRIRIMMGLVVSLVLLLVAFQLPIPQATQRVSWTYADDNDPLTTEILTLEAVEENPGGRVPITQFGIDREAMKAAQNEEPADEAGEDHEPSRVLENLARMADLRVLEFAEHQPQIEGGLRSYYLNISYPEAAQQAGIEGRLVLEFVVETDGTPTNIRLLQPLHALLDSAAVQALRRTTFTPGRQSGEDVRVRMRLPVRFELIDLDESAEDSMPSASSLSATDTDGL